MGAPFAQVIRLDATLENEERVQAFLHDALAGADCPSKACKDLRLAVEELFVNVAHYAYAPQTGEVEVGVEVAPEGDGATVCLRDSGMPFDPFGLADPATPSSIEDVSVGGLGILLVKRLMDGFSYERADGHNVVTIEKRW